MKRPIIITALVIGILLFSLFVLPIIFKGKLSNKIKESANESLNAKLNFEEVDISLFRSFPKLEIRLKNLAVTGINDFNDKTFVKIKVLSTDVALSSLWNSDGLAVTKVILEQPEFDLLVNKEGKANWDIFKPSAVAGTSPGKKPMKISLSKIQLINTSLLFQDDQSKMKVTLNAGNFDLSGVLAGSSSELKYSGEADSISFMYDGQQWASDLKVKAIGGLKANFEQMNFQFLDNKLLINQLPLELKGLFTMGDKEKLFDLTLESKGGSLDQLIGFLPLAQREKLSKYEKGGSLTFNGNVKGTYSETTWPAIQAEMKIAGGRLKYPALTNEINKIEVIAQLSKPQGSMDSLKLSVNKFEAYIAGSPVIGNLNISTPISNPLLSGDIIGEVDFFKLMQTIPLDSMEIRGIMQGNLHFKGSTASIQKGQYDQFQTRGEVKLRDFGYSSVRFPETLGIQSAGFEFTSKDIKINSLQGKLGLSDFSVDGSLSDYWSYLLKNGTLNGSFKLKSNQLDITQLMNSGPQKKDTTSAELSAIPSNINVTMVADVDKILYNRMEIRGTIGKLTIKDQKLQLENLSMNMLQGKMVVSGIYTARENTVPDFNFKLDIKDFDLPSTYQSVGAVRHFLPITGNSKGTFLSGLNLSGKVGKGYSPIFNTLNGGGLISVRNIELVGTALFADISKYFRKELFTNVKVNDFTGNLTIVNGGIAIAPFTTRIANQDVTVSGKQNASLELDYLLDFKVNRNDLNSEVTNLIGIIPGAENIEKYPIKINVVGNIAKPEVKVDLSEAKDLVAKEFTKKANSTLQDAVKKFGLDKLFK